MTAIAFAYNPALDTEFEDLGPLGVPPARPRLRLIEGGRSGQARTLAAPSKAAPSVEVYRRRRFLALVAVTLVILAIAWAAGVSVLSFGSTATDPVADAIPAIHVVLPGDSYAAIAAGLGAADPVAAGEQLRLANGGSELVVGQRLVVDTNAVLAAG